MNVPAKESSLRELILKTATRLFSENGFASTSVRQIVEACGCTNPSLYYHFSSKEELFRSVMATEVEGITEHFKSLVNGEGSVRERLAAAVRGFAEQAQSNPEGFSLLNRVERSPEESAPAFDTSVTRQLHLGMFASLIQQGMESGEIRDDLDPMDVALVLSGIISFQFQIDLQTNDWDIEQIVRTVNIAFEGFGK